jgi:hypothetical protein
VPEPISYDAARRVVLHSIDEGAADRVDALGFIEQTIYANADSPDTVTWRNGEVLDLLRDVAQRLRHHDDGPLRRVLTKLAYVYKED